MKREDVKSKIPGITDEQLDWLMGEHGRDVTAEKTRVTNLQAQVGTLTGQLQTAQDGLKAFEGVDVADLQAQITKLQGDIQAQADAFAFDALLDGAIRDGKGRSVKAIRSLLDVDALKASKNQVADIKAALEKCQQENGWAFEAAQAGDGAAETGASVSSGVEHGAGGGSKTEDGVMAAFRGLNPGLKL